METIGRKGKRVSKYIDQYVVFDLETTGISSAKDDIIEISAVKVKSHQIVDEFSKLVNPERSIPAGATRVNGITDEMVKGALALPLILPDFLDFIGDEVLVGHNIHTFDLIFLGGAAREILGRDIMNDYIDTLYMARTCLPELAHHRLTDLAQYFSVNSAGAHRALQDCRMNQACYERLGQLMGKQPVALCPKCGAELEKRSGKFGQFFGCTNYPDCKFTRNV